MVSLEVGRVESPFTRAILICVEEECSWYAQSGFGGIIELEADYKMMDVAGTLILFGLAS